MIAGLIHRVGFEEPSVNHNVSHVFRVADVGERVAIQHCKVSQFACFERSDLLVEAEVLRAFEGFDARVLRAASFRPGRTSTAPNVRRDLRAGPCAPSWMLTPASLRGSFTDAGVVQVIVLVLRHHHPAARPRVNDAARHERERRTQ